MVDIPPKARNLNSLLCDACGEMMRETRARRFQGRTLRTPCFEAEESRL
jgi:formylmethanofuran dehydrogenase subunit E